MSKSVPTDKQEACEYTPPKPPADTSQPLLQIVDFDKGAFLFDGSSDSVSANIAPNRDEVSMLHDAFIADIGSGYPMEARRKEFLFKLMIRRNPENSNLLNDLPETIPLTVTYWGWVSLAAGADARLVIVNGDTVHTRTFTGPIAEEYRLETTYSIPSKIAREPELERLAFLQIISVDGSRAGFRSEGLISLDNVTIQIHNPLSPEGKKNPEPVWNGQQERSKTRVMEWQSRLQSR